MKLTDGNHLIPFWGHPLTVTGGRDHLGMQRAALRTYAHLLPGLSNLTKRYRYYGLYCWLLDYYATQFNDPNVRKFKNYIRRSELLLAFTNSAQGSVTESGVMGSDFVKQHIEKARNAPIIWADSADIGGKKKLYWKHNGGAFYQYYLGPMKEMGLIEESKHGLPICTEFGSRLAKILCRDLESSDQNLFHDFIQRPKVSASETKNLFKTFALSAITQGTDEQKLTTEFLLGPDRMLSKEKSFFRRESLINILNTVESTGENSHAITEHYFKHWDGSPLDLENDRQKVDELWWYYHLNELGHYACESIFWCLLDLLLGDGASYQPRELVLDKLISLVDHSIKTQNTLGKLLTGYSDTRTGLIKALCDGQKKLEEYIGEEAQGEALNAALEQLFRIYNLYVTFSPKLTVDLQLLDCHASGDTLETISYFDRLKTQPAGLAIRTYISKMILSKHAENVIRKIGSGSQVTMKFIHEGAHIKGIEVVHPRLTSPRINSAIQFLKDVKLLDENGSLTDQGKLYVRKT
ncbi:MAG: hypothetical protein AB7O96_02145 [Pseudobdellovibrionaceae bacterium]